MKKKALLLGMSAGALFFLVVGHVMGLDRTLVGIIHQQRAHDIVPEPPPLGAAAADLAPRVTPPLPHVEEPAAPEVVIAPSVVEDPLEPAEDEGPARVVVPDLSRIRADRAARRVRDLGLRFSLQMGRDRLYPRDYREFGVRSTGQEPAAGTEVERGTTIHARAYYIMNEALAGY